MLWPLKRKINKYFPIAGRRNAFCQFLSGFQARNKKRYSTGNNDVPDFKGSTADLSIAFWRLIRFAMVRALASRLKEFYIKTEHDKKYISVFIKSSGDAYSVSDINVLMDNLNADSPNVSGIVHDQGVLLSLMLFNKYQAKINIISEENFTTISIGLPYLA